MQNEAKMTMMEEASTKKKNRTISRLTKEILLLLEAPVGVVVVDVVLTQSLEGVRVYNVFQKYLFKGEGIHTFGSP